MANEPDLHPDCRDLACLLGTWTGTGTGHYPTIEDFRYVEELTFGHVGKPFLSLSQRTRDASSGLPLHAESGYLRAIGDGSAELVVAQPSGIAEIDVGEIETSPEGLELNLRSVQVITTPSAKEVTEVRRLIVVTGDEMVFEMWMAAVAQPLQHHLSATLTRV